MLKANLHVSQQQFAFACQSNSKFEFLSDTTEYMISKIHMTKTS
jgi:hypothetical protein